MGSRTEASHLTRWCQKRIASASSIDQLYGFAAIRKKR
jgi:hypothetical protein